MMPELVKGTEDMGWMYEIVIVIFIFFLNNHSKVA